MRNRNAIGQKNIITGHRNIHGGTGAALAWPTLTGFPGVKCRRCASIVAIGE